MNKILQSTLFILATLSIAACSGPKEAPPKVGVIHLSDTGPSVATINGESVPASLLDALARGRGLDLKDARQRQIAMDELSDFVLLAQDAQAQGLLEQPANAAGVELLRLQGAANVAVVQLQIAAPITDAMVKTEYEREMALIGEREYRVAHILFEQEDKALEAAGAVTRGQAFMEVLEARKAEAKQARELGWAKLPQLPAEFAKTLQGLQPGQTTLLPVKTEFGWHLIHLFEMRPFVAPTLESLAPGIRQSLAERAHRERVAALRAKAKITIAAPGS